MADTYIPSGRKSRRMRLRPDPGRWRLPGEPAPSTVRLRDLNRQYYENHRDEILERRWLICNRELYVVCSNKYR
jgi:hypothetical protein